MEFKEASDVIESAFLSVHPELSDYEEGDLLIEWAFVAYVTNPDAEKASSYPILFSNGEIPTHHARGLFMHAMKSLDNADSEDQD